MSRGKFRHGEEDKVPFEKGVWFAGIEITEEGFRNHAYCDTKGDYLLLLQFLVELRNGTRRGQALAVWPGEYGTDLFELRPEVFLPILKAHVDLLSKHTMKEVQEIEWRKRYVK